MDQRTSPLGLTEDISRVLDFRLLFAYNVGVLASVNSRAWKAGRSTWSEVPGQLIFREDTCYL